MKFRLVLLTALVVAQTTIAQVDAVRQKNFNLKRGLALEGYDPVSYFDNKPKEGRREFSATVKGVTYQFFSAANLARFNSSPEKYEPAFGGWCAYAMGESGDKVKVDPETFKVLGGKLYLFYNFWGNNTLETWNKRELALKPAAEANWKKFVP
jgi:YHS domain-containing protein